MKSSNAKVSSVYLDEETWANLDKLLITHKVNSRSQMIQLLIFWECEKIGYSTEGLEQLEQERLKHLEEAKKLEEKYERLKLSQPLINIRRESLNSEYEQTVRLLVDKINNGVSINDIERVANVRLRTYLNNNWTVNELMFECLKRSKKYKDININGETK